MDAVQALKARAAAADRMMQELARDELGRMKRQAAFDRLEDQFERFAADNHLSAEELATLKRELRAQGLGTEVLDRLVTELEADGGVKVTGDLRTAMADQLRQARDGVSNPFFNYQASLLTGEYNETMQAIAAINKKLDDAYRTAIGNLKA